MDEMRTDIAHGACRTVDPGDPYAREAQTFPVLSAEEVARIAEHGTTETFEDGAPLFARGNRGADFFVVIGGSVRCAGKSPNSTAILHLDGHHAAHQNRVRKLHHHRGRNPYL